MISVFFGRTENAIMDPDITFKYGREDDWFNDEMVKEMIKDIDGCEVISPRCIESPIFGQIPPDDLSGGVKVLILMLKTDYEFDLIACGDNCAKWVAKISKIKDVKVSMSSYDLFIEDYEIDAVCLNNGNKISNTYEWWENSIKYL